MKKSTVWCVVFFWILIPGLCLADMTAKEVIKKQEKLHRVTSESGDTVMLLVDKRGNKEKRLIRRYVKEVAPDLFKFLVVFLEPADVKGTALLTWQQKDRPDDQWLYLPAQRKMQRVAKGSKKGYFMGTDFTYEDMEPEDIDSFLYEIVRSEKIDGQDCYVIEAVPATEEKKKASGYSKRAIWIRKDIFLTVKIDFFDRRGRLLKTLKNYDLKNIEGTIWRPGKMLMKNLKTKHKTLMGTKARKINISIDDKVFTERFILSGQHIK
jgi:Outer membrane lipoprotein-sorting protein